MNILKFIETKSISYWRKRAENSDELLKALRDLVDICETHDQAISQILGKPPGWKDTYLAAARAAIAKATGEAK